MTRDAAILLLLVVVAATWLLVHLRLIERTFRAPGLTRRAKWFALLPPLTLLGGWRAGARGLCVLWVVHGLTYAVLHGLS